MHDGRICRDGPSHDLVGIGEIHDHDVVLVSHTDKVVRFEREGLERDGSGLDAEGGELKREAEVRRREEDGKVNGR